MGAPTDDELHQHGWAPGEYMGDCRGCAAIFTGAKRSWRCRDCAVEMVDHVPAAPPAAAENPKTGAGRLKPEPHLVSPIAMLWITAALENGALKYGPYNWRDAAIPVNTYVSAMKRHLDEYATGVDRASDSRLPHLAHIAAGCIILMDAEAAGTLIDDRYRIAGFEEVLMQVQALKAGWVAAQAERDALKAA